MKWIALVFLVLLFMIFDLLLVVSVIGVMVACDEFPITLRVVEKVVSA